ncbi:uncharacterized protein MELLADRAFT_109178 [Melampsora larici-populina 98AG31]|uniref:Uncharacterized protein n=1 Tax=Melampsora larici-populina (strain 98AG31 / pathotype 3-4-7) TaxID=747676 RepID=F4RVM5_MELLP|nr:uncharacterized protein MELLADRAFT_109178 [Melampsora larici-populina 98AG31]EGG03554.1 hypothetical protein MELLADRAFT_109178 [Melampsora larici-populina 98AG31]
MPLQSRLDFGSSQGQPGTSGSNCNSTPSSSQPHRIRQSPSQHGNLISPSPDSRRQLSINTTPVPSKRVVEVLDGSSEDERVQPEKKKQKKKPAKKKKKPTEKQPTKTETGSTFVTKDTLRANSDGENAKVKPRATKTDHSGLHGYYGEPDWDEGDDRDLPPLSYPCSWCWYFSILRHFDNGLHTSPGISAAILPHFLWPNVCDINSSRGPLQSTLSKISSVCLGE